MGLAPQSQSPTRVATADDWECQPMPTEGTINININFLLSHAQMKKILMGHIPTAQEDHWFMYCTDSYIRFFRSWTGLLSSKRIIVKRATYIE